MPCSSSSSLAHQQFSIFVAGSNSSQVNKNSFCKTNKKTTFTTNYSDVERDPDIDRLIAEMVKACYLVNVIQLSAREHWHCCLLSHVFFYYNPCHSRCQTGTFLSRYYREKKKDFNDDNNRLSNPLTLIFISIFLFCFFGRRVFNSWCLGFPWRLVGSICPRSMRSFSKTFLSGTMRTSMGLYLGNDRRG